MRQFTLTSKLHPPRPKDLSKWSMWYREVVGFAADAGLKRVSKTVYRELFSMGLSPREAVQHYVERRVR